LIRSSNIPIEACSWQNDAGAPKRGRERGREGNEIIEWVNVME
jgi:hypothetical protein